LVAKIVNQVAPVAMSQDPSVISDGDQPPVSASLVSDTPEGSKATGQSYVTPGKAKRLSDEDRAEVGWVSPSSPVSDLDSVRARERRSKLNHDRPSRRLVLEAVEAADKAVVAKNSPAPLLH
jgi:hypothetical protein